MRSLLEYFIDGESVAGIQDDDKFGQATAVPEAGLLIGIAYNVTNDATTVPTTFDIYKGGGGSVVDTGVDALLPVTLQNEGGLMNVTGRVECAAGDYLRLRSNGETGGTPNIYLTWIIRR